MSEVPYIPHSEMIKICEAMLPYWNKIRYAKEDEGCLVEEFVL